MAGLARSRFGTELKGVAVGCMTTILTEVGVESRIEPKELREVQPEGKKRLSSRDFGHGIAHKWAKYHDIGWRSTGLMNSRTSLLTPCYSATHN